MGRISVPRYLIIIVSLVAALWLIQQVFSLFYQIADILLIFGLAWLLKLLLDPLIRRLELLRVPRGAAIAIAYTLVIGGLLGGLVWLVPQLTVLAEDLPMVAQGIASGRAQEITRWLGERGVEIDSGEVNQQIVNLGTRLASLVAQRSFDVARNFVGVMARIALVVTVAVYMSMTAGRRTDVLRPVIPPRWRDEYDNFVRDVNTAYSSYIRGYFYVVALGTLMSAALLYGFQIPNATLWVLFVLLLRVLPFIGGTLADVLLVVVVIFNLSVTSAIVAIVLIIVGQAVLTNVLMPRVMSRELGINPLLVLFAVLLGGRIYGLAGVLFSIPAAAIIAAIIGRAVKRYLLPLYETGGWWTDQVTVAEAGDRRRGVERRGTSFGTTDGDPKVYLAPPSPRSAEQSAPRGEVS